MAHAQDAAAPQPRAETAGLAYVPEIKGVDGGLRDLIVESISLFRLRDKPPVSIPALRARLDADLDTVEDVLRSEGHYAFRVDHRIDARQHPVLVRLEVEPGPVYRLNRYAIRYGDADAGSSLPHDPDLIGIELGSPAKAGTMIDAQGRLVRLLGERGHPFADVVKREVVVDHRDRSVAVTLDVRAGPAATFGLVSVEGNRDVTSSYLRRLSDLQPGDTFDLSVVDGTRRRLFASGLFDSVAIDWPKQADADGQVPLTIKVVERDRRTIALGLNYSSTEGAGVDLGWTHRNLFGRGERLELGARLAQREMSAYADFLKPTMGRLDQNLISRVELRDLETDAFDQRSLAGSLGLQRRLGERWRASLSTGIEATEIDEPAKPLQTYVIYSLPGVLSYDGSNDLLDPSKGARLTVEAAPSQVTGDSNANFLVGSVTGSVYHEALSNKRVVLAARARVASIVGADHDDVPASRRFYSGGGGSVRGYAFQSLGPLDGANNPVGGLSLLETSFEARIRVFGDFGIVPFVEGGSAFEDSRPTGRPLRWAAGIGLRYYTAIGPLRLDVARPLDRRSEIDDAFAVFISLGQSF